MAAAVAHRAANKKDAPGPWHRSPAEIQSDMTLCAAKNEESGPDSGDEREQIEDGRLIDAEKTPEQSEDDGGCQTGEVGSCGENRQSASRKRLRKNRRGHRREHAIRRGIVDPEKHDGQAKSDHAVAAGWHEQQQVNKQENQVAAQQAWHSTKLCPRGGPLAPRRLPSRERCQRRAGERRSRDAHLLLKNQENKAVADGRESKKRGGS